MDGHSGKGTQLREPCKWERFLSAHGDVFFLFARQLTRTESDAKDVTQQVLVEIWKNAGGEIPNKAQVFSTLRRRAIDLGRSKDRRSRREVEFASRSESWFVPDYGNQDTIGMLEEALKALSDTLREVVILRVWGNLSFPEIAGMTGTSVPTATSRFRYGIEQLRKSEIISELKV